MAQNRFSSTIKDSLTVRQANLAEGAAIKESLIAQQGGLSRTPVGKKFFTTADQREFRYLAQTNASNAAELIGS